MDILLLMRRFREYEKYYTADNRDQLEWRDDFLSFILWLVTDREDSKPVTLTRAE